MDRAQARAATLAAVPSPDARPDTRADDSRAETAARVGTCGAGTRRAEVIEAIATARGEIGIGSTVEIEDDAGEQMTVEISSVGGVSPTSPLGRALLGAKPDDEVDVEASRGTWRARVIAVGGRQPADR